jgi:dephospho-CoA kinase
MRCSKMVNTASTSPWQIDRFSIGLTGGIGCGKTTVADMFAMRGAAVIDTDQIAHQLTTPGGAAIPSIRTRFGEEFLTATGAMDRAKMRELVFADPAAKKELESILHPLIRTETERAAAQAQGVYLLFVVPLLIESGKWTQQVSRILVIDCAEELQIQRVMHRNGLSEQQVRAIMATQVSRAVRLAAADDVVVNDSDTAALIPQIERLHTFYSSLASQNRTKQP